MMKRTLLLLSIVALPFMLQAQNRTITIDWDSESKDISSAVVGSKKVSVKKKRTAFYKNLQISDNDLGFYEQWKDNGFAKENSLQITNVVYGSLSEEELKKVNKSLVPQDLTYSIHSSKARAVLYTSVSMSPVIKGSDGYKKIRSFSVSYKYKVQRNSGVRLPISNSVLASGNWFKFKVEKTGIHRIDKNFLSSLGMNTDGIDPRNLKVYGHGGKPLPLLNALNTVFDVPENAIQVIGEEDGSFDNGDHILFYGISTLGYDAENDTNINPYSDDSYYFVTADGVAGKRVQPMVEPNEVATTTITQFNDYQFHELDEVSPALVGRRWYGNRFDIESDQTFEFNFPNIVGSVMDIKVKAAAASETATSMAITINGTSVNPLTFSGVSGLTFLNTQQYVDEFPVGGETVTVQLVYNNSGNPSSVGYLDYLSVEALRALTGVEGQLAFRYNDVATLSGIGEYQINNASQFSQVWDVTNTAVISAKQNPENASSVSFKAFLGAVREYVAVSPSDYFAPVKGVQTRVVNQDLKGTIFNDESGNFKDIDYLIVTAPFLIQPALRLANHHKNVNGLSVKVVTTDKIYEEFSSGKQDISAIRNFVRYIYENASEQDKRIKYLCLFGDTSIDYKNRLSGNNNIIPSFHALLSTNEVSSFMSDDFFGNMDAGEGTIGLDNDGVLGNGSDIDLLDIAIGRIVADEVSLANTLVDKIVNYQSKASYGNWRNNFVLISDDLGNAGEFILEKDLDELGDEITAEKPFINVKKIHCDAYQQETSAGGDRYPKVNEAIKDAIEVGAVIVNYFGHGGEDGLAHEFIYTRGIAQSLQNKNNLPCVVTVTCEFSKFDNPLRTTAGELTYWNANGGAISLVSTTRAISIGLGIDFNRELAAELFGYRRNIPNTPAEALRVSKNRIGTGSKNRRVVFYIGDPAMRLAFPKQKIHLTTINDVPVGQSTVVLEALSKVKIGGEVLDENGALLTSYNGVLETKVYDKNVQRRTLDNDGYGLFLDFITLGEGLFNGQASVTNGKFEFEFVVPRDIQIPVGKGKISFYAQKNGELEDQTGFNLDIQIGGLDENAPEDTQGPSIKLFMNDESFVSGGITNDSPILIAKLEDEHGINTASGIGHDIIAILDGDEANPFVINEYYQADVDDFTKGAVNYKLRDLEDGLHTLTLKAWDVYNNSAIADIQFVVAGNDSLVLEHVLNYPNPFVNYTEFWFNHNRPFEPLDVQVQVFTVTGKVVWTKSDTFSPNGSNLFRAITWNGMDDFGDKIGKGVYVYKITVKSTLTNHQVEKFEKLVIL